MSRLIRYILLFMITSIISAGNISDIHRLLVDHFSKLYKVKAGAVHVKIIQEKNWFYSDYLELADSAKNEFRTGPQIIWFYARLDNQIQKVPLKIELSVELPVWITSKDVKKNDLLDTSNMIYQPVIISKNLQNYITEKNYPKVPQFFKQRLSAGSPILSYMVSPLPDIKRGDKIQIILENKNFEITVQGTARQDGMVGDHIRAVCNISGKRITGTVQDKNTIIIGR